MADIINKKQTVALVKTPDSALQELPSDIVHRAIHDIDQLIDRDVNPIPLGIEGSDGLMIVAFMKGSLIPCETILLTTLNPDIDGNFQLNLFQGYAPYVRKNHLLSKCYVRNDSGLTGQWPVSVKLMVDSNGILTIEVTDVITEKLCKLDVHYSAGLSINDMEELERKWKK